MNTLRTRLIDHILNMRKSDAEYARYALRQYNDLLPFLNLNQAIREALK